MDDYIGKMLYGIPEHMKGGSATPAAHQLFYILEDATKISRPDADLFRQF